MKNKKLMLIIVILGLTSSLFSCNNCQHERQKLQSMNDSLKKRIDSLEGRMSLEKTTEETRLIGADPYETRAEALVCVNRFRNAQQIDIPISVRFKQSDLNLLASYPYARFYFGVKPSTTQLTLVAVGVNAGNLDNDAEITLPTGGTTTEIVEFADPCPPCPINSVNQPYSYLYNSSSIPSSIIFDKH